MNKSLTAFVDTRTQPNPVYAQDSFGLLQMHIQIFKIVPYQHRSKLLFELADKSVIELQEHQDYLLLWAQKNRVPGRLVGKRELAAAYRILHRQAPSWTDED